MTVKDLREALYAFNDDTPVEVLAKNWIFSLEEREDAGGVMVEGAIKTVDIIKGKERAILIIGEAGETEVEVGNDD